MPCSWQGSHWNANFEVTGMTWPGKIQSQMGSEPRIFHSRGRRLNHWAKVRVMQQGDTGTIPCSTWPVEILSGECISQPFPASNPLQALRVVPTEPVQKTVCVQFSLAIAGPLECLLCPSSDQRAEGVVVVGEGGGGGWIVTVGRLVLEKRSGGGKTSKVISHRGSLSFGL